VTDIKMLFRWSIMVSRRCLYCGCHRKNSELCS